MQRVWIQPMLRRAADLSLGGILPIELPAGVLGILYVYEAEDAAHAGPDPPLPMDIPWPQELVTLESPDA